MFFLNLCKWWARRPISLHRDNKVVLYNGNVQVFQHHFTSSVAQLPPLIYPTVSFQPKEVRHTNLEQIWPSPTLLVHLHHLSGHNAISIFTCCQSLALCCKEAADTVDHWSWDCYHLICTLFTCLMLMLWPPLIFSLPCNHTHTYTSKHMYTHMPHTHAQAHTHTHITWNLYQSWSNTHNLKSSVDQPQSPMRSLTLIHQWFKV